jgi:Zn-dependent protease with chaperone function
MTAGTWLLLYGTALAWLAPLVLGRLTRTGVSPQMGVAAWVMAVATMIIAWIVALVLIGVAAIDGLKGSSAVALCLELFGLSEHGGLPWLGGSIALTVAGSALLIAFVLRTRRSVTALRSRSREHAKAVLLVGRPTMRSGVVVVDAHRPAAYCVSGHPPAIVVTSAAWSALSTSELAAVVAHEQAHIAGRHHQVMMVLRAMATAFPRLPLLTQSVQAVGALLEMCADDAAAGRHGANTLLGGLLVMATPHRVPAEGLAAAGTATAVRAMRLADPAGERARWSQRAVLLLTMTAMLGAPALIELLCHH